jgi:hypothetical protein
MWTVIYFAPETDTTTRVRVVSMGFGSDDESKKMREFSNRGNALTLQHLQIFELRAEPTKADLITFTQPVPIDGIQVTAPKTLFPVRPSSLL